MHRGCLLLLPLLSLVPFSLTAAEAPAAAAPTSQLAIADFTRPASLSQMALNPAGSCFAALSWLSLEHDGQ